VTRPTVQDSCPCGPGDLEILGALCLPFVCGLAHELGNLQAGIQGNVHLLRVGQVEPTAGQCLDEIDECSRRAQDLLSLLRRCARPETRPVRFGLAGLLADLVTLVTPLARRRSLQVRVHRTSELLEREGFPWRLRAALLGLVTLILEVPGAEGATLEMGLLGDDSNPVFEIKTWSPVSEQLCRVLDAQHPGGAGACQRVLAALGCVFEVLDLEQRTRVRIDLGRSRTS